MNYVNQFECTIFEMEASLKFQSFLSLTLILAFSIFCESTSDNGFTMEMIHRDSPRSLYYNPTDTPHQRTANAVRRSISRTERLNANSLRATNTPSSVIAADGGEYIMNISLGSPPVTIVAIVDTGSDLIWTQCLPCTNCFNQSTPFFDPSKSSTFNKILCEEPQCKVIDGTTCSGAGELCVYDYSYADGSYTKGTLATETLTLGSTSGQPMSFPTVIFGCGNDNNMTLGGFATGIVGLGGGNASLITQLGKANGGKFSYCFVPYSSNYKVSSKLSFGADAVVAGDGVVSTPLIIPGPEKAFYYLTLEAVSVGKARIEFPSEDTTPASGDKGNIIIDSGMALTLLPQDFYTMIEAAMINSVKLTKVNDPYHRLSLCYQANTDPRDSIPILTFHFAGADVGLNFDNTFIWVTDNIICFTLIADRRHTIYGNTAQSNYLIGYDIENMMLSFKPVDCTSSTISLMGRVLLNSYGLCWFGVLFFNLLMW